MGKFRAPNRLRFAIIGCGRHAQQKFLPIDRYLSSVCLAAVCDRNIEVLGRVKDVRPEVLVTPDLDQVLACGELSFVIIATAPDTHFALACRCLEQGKHVLLEKPMTATIDEAHRLRQLLVGRTELLMVGHHRRFGRAEGVIGACIGSGRLGQVIAIQVTHNFNDDSRSPVSGYLSAGGSRLSGVLFEYLSHELDLLRFLFPDVEVSAVDCRLQSVRHRDDTAAVQLVLDNGVLVSYLLCSATTDLEVYRVFGTDGQITFDRYRDPEPRFYPLSRLRNRPLRLLLQLRDGIGTVRQLRYARQRNIIEAYIDELDYFAGCIREQRRPVCSVEAGVFVLETLERIYHQAGEE